MKRLPILLCLEVLLALTLFGQRNYHSYAITDITALTPDNWHGKFLTHIQIEGWITYKSHEGDKDWHLRVCDDAKLKMMDAKHCMVSECVPELPCTVPKVGDRVRVRGIGRYDAENPGHHWWEIHPVEELEVLR